MHIRRRVAALAVVLSIALPCSIADAATTREELIRRMQQCQELVKAGVGLMQEKKYAEAEAKFVEADKLIPGSPIIQYNLACLYSLTGKKDEALKALERSIEGGYVDVEHMKEDKDLDAIRDADKYKELMTLAEKRAKGLEPVIHVPKGYEEKGEKTYPLFVTLHGAGGTPNGMMQMAKQTLGETGYFILAPCGSAPMGPGYTWDDRDFKKVADEIAALKKQYRIGRTYLFGFSAGAHVGYVFAIKQRELFDGFIPMAGGIGNAMRGGLLKEEDLKGVKGLPIYAIQGTKDDMVPLAAAEQALDKLKANGAVTTMFKHDGGHAPPANMAKVLADAIKWIDEQNAAEKK